MTGAIFQIPEGTPLLSRDGLYVVARFRFLQGACGGYSDILTWQKLSPVRSYAMYADAGLESAVMQEDRLQARRVFNAPGLQVWQADFETPSHHDWPFEEFFPPDMFIRPANTQPLKVAAAIETVLEDRVASHIVGVISQIKDELASYGQHLKERGRSHVG